MVLVEADVPEVSGFGVDVKLGLLGVVGVFDEESPLVEEGLFCFDEVGQVGRHHGDDLAYVEFLN